MGGCRLNIPKCIENYIKLVEFNLFDIVQSLDGKKIKCFLFSFEYDGPFNSEGANHTAIENKIK